jgi:hypothetical protein
MAVIAGTLSGAANSVCVQPSPDIEGDFGFLHFRFIAFLQELGLD